MIDHEISDLEGGYYQVRKRMWKGVLKVKSTGQYVWTCAHRHSRPEFNARWERGIHHEPYYGIWEYSALNCGRAAYKQRANGIEILSGEIGPVSSDTDIPDRPDFRKVSVGDMNFQGAIYLDDSGMRVIQAHEVHAGTSGKLPKIASLNLDAPRSGWLDLSRLSLDENVHRMEENYFITALWLLKGVTWGVMFHDHTSPLSLTRPDPLALEELVPDMTKKPRRRKKPEALVDSVSAPVEILEEATEPYIKSSILKGRRVFQLISGEEIVSTFFQRGKAANELKKLKP